jgi:chemotaxis protein MotB
LLALFVVLYASARLDAERNLGLFEGLRSAFSSNGSERSGEDDVGPGAAADDREPNTAVPGTAPFETIAPLRQLERQIAREVERERRRIDRDPGVSLHASERGLVISLAAAEYFPAGGAEIPPERKRLLAAIAPLLAAEGGSLEFEGHTDDRPIGEGPFPTNWELSSARAAAVARYFIDEHAIDPHRVATTGYASYRPVSDGQTPAERARNRRVEIVVLADGELVGKRTARDPERELGRLLEALPPIPAEEDDALRPPDPGPAPLDIPLP